MKRTAEEGAVYTIGEVAALTGLSRNTVVRLFEKGRASSPWSARRPCTSGATAPSAFRAPCISGWLLG
jgi:predicted DNA-binding transcriptional regulator AlpA